MILITGCDPRTASRAPSPSTAPALVPLTNMVLVKAGSFTRASQRVTISRDFWLGKYEVTQSEYAAFAGKIPSHFPGDPSRPVEKLTHADATAYCSALTRREKEAGRLVPGYEYRLPTEANGIRLPRREHGTSSV
jgi:formylglycine-generating enzyme required for sulfatase activity